MITFQSPSAHVNYEDNASERRKPKGDASWSLSNLALGDSGQPGPRIASRHRGGPVDVIGIQACEQIGIGCRLCRVHRIEREAEEQRESQCVSISFSFAGYLPH
jgi:hypothetical protein